MHRRPGTQSASLLQIQAWQAWWGTAKRLLDATIYGGKPVDNDYFTWFDMIQWLRSTLVIRKWQRLLVTNSNQLKPTQTNSSTNHIRSQTHVAVEDMDRSTSDEEDVATGANKILGESRLVYKKTHRKHNQRCLKLSFYFRILIVNVGHAASSLFAWLPWVQSIAVLERYDRG